MSWGVQRRLTACIAALVVLAGAFALITSQASTAGAQAGQAELRIESVAAPAGTEVAVGVDVVPDVGNPAGVQFTLRWGTAPIEVVDCTAVAANAWCNLDTDLGTAQVAAVDPVGFGADEPTRIVELRVVVREAGPHEIGADVADAIDLTEATIAMSVTSGLLSTATTPEPTGDVNCDGLMNVLDALFVTQYLVDLRTDGGACPVPDPATQADISVADLNRDGRIDIVDALVITQCEVEIATIPCPPAEVAP